MRVAECVREMILPNTVDVTVSEEREKLNRLGSEIAVKEGFHFEGYTAATIEPYSLQNAKAVLYFN
ncbi:MAG TPA: hypothetical protein VMT55_01040 [Candidatus Sulfotelmatobacter sp.]|nr:hypothetical protein [Candidatus Sulfotelmatobacter sp.]